MKSGRPTGLPTCLKRLSRFGALPYPPSLGGWPTARSWRARVVDEPLGFGLPSAAGSAPRLMSVRVKTAVKGAAKGLKSGRRRWAEMLAARLWPAIGTGLPRLGWTPCRKAVTGLADRSSTTSWWSGSGNVRRLTPWMWAAARAASAACFRTWASSRSGSTRPAC